MTITRDSNRRIVLLCDGKNSKQCRVMVDTQLVDFGQALAEAKRQGWRAVSNIGAPGYKHACPACNIPHR